MKKIVRESLSPSEALYGFGSWLTVRKEPITLSSKHDAGIVAELVDEFIKKQKLKEPKKHWEKELIPMKETLKESKMETETIEVIIRKGCGENIKKIIECIKATGNKGHSFEIVIDTELTEEKENRTFYWDGDGSDYIESVKLKK